MPRPLSCKAPPAVSDLLRSNNYKDLAHLAEMNGLEPRTVQYLFAENSNKSLFAYRKMADILGVSLDDIYRIFTGDDISHRREWLLEKMAERDIPSIRRLADVCDMNPGTICSIIAGKNNCGNLTSYKRVSDCLGLKLNEFARIF